MSTSKKIALLMKVIEGMNLKHFLTRPRTRAEKATRTRALNSLSANDQQVVWLGEFCPDGGDPIFCKRSIVTVGDLMRADGEKFRRMRNLGTKTKAYLARQMASRGLAIGQLIPE